MRLRTWAILAAGALALAGCGHFDLQARRRTTNAPQPPVAAPAPAPTPEPEKVVRVRVPVKCVPDDLGPPPAYPDSDAALRDAGGAADRYQLLAAGRLMRNSRLLKLEEVIHHCRAAAQAR